MITFVAHKQTDRHLAIDTVSAQRLCIAVAVVVLCRITPMFKLSCVTGENVALFQRFLYMLPPQKSHNERARLSQDLTEFQIDELYSVPHVGTVVGGVIKRYTSSLHLS